MYALSRKPQLNFNSGFIFWDQVPIQLRHITFRYLCLLLDLGPDL